jgi:hypothetical protein
LPSGVTLRRVPPVEVGYQASEEFAKLKVPLRAFWNVLCVFCLNDGGSVCPESDIDLVELGQRIKTLEDQLKSLAERLSRAELQLKELEAEREGGWKKFSDP